MASAADVAADMTALPALPLTEDLLEHPAFVSGDAALVRAHIRLLRRAWLSRPAATLPVDEMLLADAAGLPVDAFRAARLLLLSGWEPDGRGRLKHPALAERAYAIWNRHGDALEQIAADIAAISAEPDSFELVAPGVDATRRRGKRLLPRNFTIAPAVRGYSKERGFSEEQLQTLFDSFRSNAAAKDWKYADWDAAFRNFIEKAPQMSGVVPVNAPALSVVAGTATFGGLGRFSSQSKREALDTRNAAAVDRASQLLRTGAAA
jgi:hypothetical protein